MGTSRSEPAAVSGSCDAVVALCAPSAPAASRPGLVLAATILASSLAFVDGSVVNVALPAIGQNLRADAGMLQWVINSYLLPLSALLLLGGAAGDHLGRRRLLVAGTALFALASRGCAAAPNQSALLATRLLQYLTGKAASEKTKSRPGVRLREADAAAPMKPPSSASGGR